MEISKTNQIKNEILAMGEKPLFEYTNSSKDLTQGLLLFGLVVGLIFPQTRKTLLKMSPLFISRFL